VTAAVDVRAETGRGARTAAIAIRGLTKAFAGPKAATIEVLRDVDLDAADGEFVSVIGPSGCGKSTLFGIVVGLEDADRGHVSLYGEPVGARHVAAFMPQKDLLFPWRSVLDNVALPLQIHGTSKKLARERARELMPVFGLEGFEEAYPFTLSGGMRQRASLLRTIVQERPLLLLDEPFGALDSLTRTDMQEFLLDIWSRFRRTILFITHDIREAIYLSDRIYVMTARPARVRMVLEVPLERPRHLDMIATPQFARLEARLLEALREEYQSQHVREEAHADARAR
jgi:ABC-type nitrate/sulfonate/bicarbonate transport system ATPase subunit